MYITDVCIVPVVYITYEDVCVDRVVYSTDGNSTDTSNTSSVLVRASYSILTGKSCPHNSLYRAKFESV